MGGRFSEFRERRDEYETDESKHECKESVDEKGQEKTDPESWMKEVAREVEEQEAKELQKAERLVKEVRKELERQERIEAEERRTAEEWMKEVAKEIEKKDHEDELERELRRAERVLQEIEADEVADYAGRENWPTPKRRYEVYRGDVTGEGKSHETEEVDEVVKKVVKELDETEASEAQSESKESTNVKRPKGWDPTIDELDDYEKVIAKAYEKTGATEEEMKERWRERYVDEIQNIMDKEPPHEESSSDSLEGRRSSKGRELKDSEVQSEEYVESGDGTSSTMVMEQSSKELFEQDESKSETPSENETGDTPNDTTENSESTSEEDEDIGEKSKEPSHESASEKQEYSTYPESPTHHRREIDNYSEEENSEPSEKFREEYESRPKSTQFSENDRAPESLSRVVDQVEKSTEYQKLPSLMDGQVECYSEPSIGKLEHSEKPRQKISQQEVYEDNLEDIPSKEMVHEYNSEQSIDSEENPPHQDECTDESKTVHEITKNLEEVMEEDDTETEDIQESSYEHKLHEDELIEVTSKAIEDESEAESESLYEYSESHQEEEGLESTFNQEFQQDYVEDASESDTFSEGREEPRRDFEKEEAVESLNEDNTKNPPHEDVIVEELKEQYNDSCDEVHSETKVYKQYAAEYDKANEEDEIDSTESEEIREEVKDFVVEQVNQSTEVTEDRIDEKGISLEKERLAPKFKILDESTSESSKTATDGAKSENNESTKQETSERLTPKQSDIDYQNERIEEHPKTQEKIKHRGKSHEIKIVIPKIRGREIWSDSELIEYIEEECPGFKERNDFDSLLNTAINHVRLRESLRTKKEIKLYEVRKIAERIGMKTSTAFSQVFQGVIPRIYHFLDQAISKSEGTKIVRRIRVKLDGIGCWNDVENRLNEIYKGNEYEIRKRFQLRKKRVIQFFEFLNQLEKGGTIQGIAKRIGVPIRVAAIFGNGEIPYLIKHAIPSLRKSKERITPYEMKIKTPKIRDIIIHSFKQLKTIVNKDFTWMKKREDYNYLLTLMKKHIEIINELKEKASITRIEILELAKRFNISPDTITFWLVQGRLPKGYDLISKGLSLSEVSDTIRCLHKLLNGIKNRNDFNQRLNTFFLIKHLKNLPTYKEDLKAVRNFFRFLEGLKHGGLIADLARYSGASWFQAKSWLKNKRLPRLIRIVSSIPAQKPKHGYRWLPMKFVNSYPVDYIQVPTKIRRLSDLLDTIIQLKPLKSRKMKSWKKQFGDLSYNIAFMYFLGLIVSDGSSRIRNGLSTYTNVRLSDTYNWSTTVGNAFCYCLGCIGIGCNRNKNQPYTTKTGEKHNYMIWQSNSSPLFWWIIKTLLGLTTTTPKGKTGIQADWIKAIPDDLRAAFIQGVADGDGWTCVRGTSFGISSYTNSRFLRELLASFGIKVNNYSKGIQSSARKSIQKAAQLPLFRYAYGKQMRLKELVRIRDAMKIRRRITDEEKELIIRLHSEGNNIGDILVILWIDYEIARNRLSIANVLRHYLKMKKQKT